jgi:hypothetical protein
METNISALRFRKTFISSDIRDLYNIYWAVDRLMMEDLHCYESVIHQHSDACMGLVTERLWQRTGITPIYIKQYREWTFAQDVLKLKQIYPTGAHFAFSDLVGKWFESESDDTAAASGSAAAVARKLVLSCCPYRQRWKHGCRHTLALVCVNRHRKHMLTRSCLRYTREQFKQAWNTRGRGETVTGDRGQVCGSSGM